MRYVVCTQPIGIQYDLILPDHPADACHFGHIRHRLQFIFEKPVLQRAQLRQIHSAATVYQRVLVDPANAGGIRPERGARLRRQARLHLIQILEHARPRPIRIGAILKQNVDEGVAKE